MVDIRIKFHGLACFSIQFGDILLVFDPHDGDYINLEKPEVRNADIVLCSHAHYDHNLGKSLVSNKQTFILEEKEGSFSYKGVEIHGIKVRHGDWPNWGYNVVYSVKFSSDFVVIHGGDIGYLPNQDELSSLLYFGNPAIAILPIGAKYTINAEQAVELSNLLQPRMTTIVCHYLYGPLLKNEEFAGMTTEKSFLQLEKVNNLVDIVSDWEISLPYSFKPYTLFDTSFIE